MAKVIKKKKKLKVDPEGIGYIKSTFNNTVITLTDKYGNTISWASSGVVGFKGSIELDDSKPDGMKVKKLDTSLINNLGWHPKIELEPGLKKTYTC